MDKVCLNFAVLPFIESTANTVPSYLLGHDDLFPDTFRSYGLLCRRDPGGYPVCNVVLDIRLTESLRPHWGDASGPTEQLALNVLRAFCLDLDQTNIGDINHPIRQLAVSFADEVLSEMPEEGGCVPIDQIEQWLCRKLVPDWDF